MAAESEQDAGRRDASTGTERLCVVTRATKPVDELIRFVLGPDGSVVPDLKRNLPGRGVWVTADHSSVTAAAKARVFGRAFKTEVKIPPDLAGLTQRLLERQVLDALAMARKAGQAVTGFTRVEEALASASLVALIQASDASPDGVRKMTAAAARRLGEDAERIPLVTGFTSVQLDLAFGRSNVVHAALLGGAASKGFLSRWHRLEQFMGAERATVHTAKRGSPRARD